GSDDPADERGEGAGHAGRHVGHRDSTSSATEENPASASRLAMVGMSRQISPAAPRARASAGAAQIDSTVSAASWEATWPGGTSGEEDPRLRETRPGGGHPVGQAT